MQAILHNLRLRLIVPALIVALLGVSITGSQPPTLTAAVGDLYGVDGAGDGEVGTPTSPSTLYKLNPLTGAVIQTIGSTGFSHVTAIDFDPISGKLYGIASDRSNEPGTQLIEINTTTGAGTLVALMSFDVDGPYCNVPDISFNSTGALYAWGSATMTCSW